jgi:hypothetical protein
VVPSVDGIDLGGIHDHRGSFSDGLSIDPKRTMEQVDVLYKIIQA